MKGTLSKWTAAACGLAMAGPAWTAPGQTDAPRQAKARAELKALPPKLTQVETKLREVETRLLRSQRAVPTGEEFRQQVADGRKRIEVLRSIANDAWKEAGRIANARGVKMDSRILKEVTPPELAEDAEFQAARKKAMEEDELVKAFEERLIEVMLTTTFGDSGPVPETKPDAQALALEWENLRAHQKILTTAVQNARAKATAAKVEFDPAELFDASATSPGKVDAGLAKAKEQAKVALERREATAELVASMEFLKAVGRPYKNW